MRRSLRGDDGSELLTGPGVEPLLRAAVEHRGGSLLSWNLHHVDANPEQSTTATYRAKVRWPAGDRDEMLGISARSGGLKPSDSNAEIFADGSREVAVWLYPWDPDLPGLPRATVPEQLADLLTSSGVPGGRIVPGELKIDMIGYRPRRRAVVRIQTRNPPAVFYVKVLRPKLFAQVLHKHQMLFQGGTPSPEVVLHTPDHLMFLRELPGKTLARAIFEPGDPCTAEQLIAVLDQMPASVGQLERRRPWADAVDHYATMVAAALPEVATDVEWAANKISEGLAGYPPGNEATHGDFHEGQIHVANKGIVGILDVDTIGPGRRADDLACLIAHLSTIQRMNKQQSEKVRDLLVRWVPVFDERVDAVELRLRAAAVVISLATGPYRGQEEGWQATTQKMIRSALALIQQVS